MFLKTEFPADPRTPEITKFSEVITKKKRRSYSKIHLSQMKIELTLAVVQSTTFLVTWSHLLPTNNLFTFSQAYRSISSNHCFKSLNDSKSVQSYTIIIPWAPLQQLDVMVRKRSCPAVSHYKTKKLSRNIFNGKYCTAQFVNLSSVIVQHPQTVIFTIIVFHQIRLRTWFFWMEKHT